MITKKYVLPIFLFFYIVHPTATQAMPLPLMVQKMLVFGTFVTPIVGYLNKKLPKSLKRKNRTAKNLKKKYKQEWVDFHCELFKTLHNDQKKNILAYVTQLNTINKSAARAAEKNYLTVAYIALMRPQKNPFVYNSM
ncbi:hypothetical protein EKK58_01980 [Candidatus Dependentiae bacterium]|nr:MAG: hypothetical protein EKK58_01980 [Candidatus Dependentiae bacterium]